MSEERFVLFECANQEHLIRDTKIEKFLNMFEINDQLNKQQDTIEGLLLDRNRQEEKLDVAREKLEKQVKQLKKDKISMNTMIKNFEKLEKENRILKDYIDSIFEGNTHICKYLDIEDVKFYCLQNEDYESPSCLYKKCFDEKNFIEVGKKINEVCD